MASQTAGFKLTGKISDIDTMKTKEGKDLFFYFVFTGRNVERVKSMKNGAKVGDSFNSFVSVKPYVSKTGYPGMEIWEGERLA